MISNVLTSPSFKRDNHKVSHQENSNFIETRYMYLSVIERD